VGAQNLTFVHTPTSSQKIRVVPSKHKTRRGKKLLPMPARHNATWAGARLHKQTRKRAGGRVRESQRMRHNGTHTRKVGIGNLKRKRTPRQQPREPQSDREPLLNSDSADGKSVSPPSQQHKKSLTKKARHKRASEQTSSTAAVGSSTGRTHQDQFRTAPAFQRVKKRKKRKRSPAKQGTYQAVAPADSANTDETMEQPPGQPRTPPASWQGVGKKRKRSPVRRGASQDAEATRVFVESTQRSDKPAEEEPQGQSHMKTALRKAERGTKKKMRRMTKQGEVPVAEKSVRAQIGSTMTKDRTAKNARVRIRKKATKKEHTEHTRKVSKKQSKAHGDAALAARRARLRGIPHDQPD